MMNKLSRCCAINNVEQIVSMLFVTVAMLFVAMLFVSIWFVLVAMTTMHYFQIK